jgi:glycosyltransferase involved in cell wall biosynthesis
LKKKVAFVIVNFNSSYFLLNCIQSIYKYSSKDLFEIIIVDNLTDDQILDIHYSCDCFVTASHGEAWGYPIMDALGMGKYPICPNQGGAKDMIDSNRVGQLVDCYDSPCINVKDTFSGLFIGKENWKSIDISQLKQRMRISYNRLKNKSLRGWVKSDSNIRIKNYDYERVGTKLKEIIYG